jgi:hypothetical protein
MKCEIGAKSRDIAADGEQSLKLNVRIRSHRPIPYRGGTNAKARDLSV